MVGHTLCISAPADALGAGDVLTIRFAINEYGLNIGAGLDLANVLAPLAVEARRLEGLFRLIRLLRLGRAEQCAHSCNRFRCIIIREFRKCCRRLLVVRDFDVRQRQDSVTGVCDGHKASVFSGVSNLIVHLGRSFYFFCNIGCVRNNHVCGTNISRSLCADLNRSYIIC